MYASASTWAFNVVRLIGESATGTPPRTRFFSGQGDFGEAALVDIAKSHEISDEATVLELAKRARRIICSTRDARDAVTSMMLAHRYEFSVALRYVEASARLARDFSRDSRTLLLRYETGFFDQPETVNKLAAHLGVALSAADATRIFEALSRGAVEAYIAKMATAPGILQDRLSGDLLDPRTQWHKHHAGRSGETGRWKDVLTAAQAEEIGARLGKV